MKVSILLAILLLLTVFIPVNIVFAQEENIGYSTIDPSSPLYFLKSIREILELKFAGTPRIGAIRHLEFSTRRLREANSLSGGKNEDLIIANMEKYWYELNLVLQFGPRDNGLTILIDHTLAIQMKDLSKLFDMVRSARVKLSIGAQVNKIIQKQNIPDDVKRDGCNILVKEASSSALNEAEKEIVAQRASICLKAL